MNYADYVLTMQNILAVDSPTEENFVQILPAMIDYASNRMQADLDLLALNTSETIQLVANKRTADVPNCMYIVNSVNVVTPSVTRPDAGTRIQLQRLSVEAMNFMWPEAGDTDVPQNYALLNDSTIIFGPVPDAGYKAEFYGVYNLPPLSESNPTNYLTENLPDLFIAASCVFGFGYQRDFGAQASDPGTAQSWENQYQLLLKSETVQAYRQYARSSAWQPYSPAPLATPPRA